MHAFAKPSHAIIPGRFPSTGAPFTNMTPTAPNGTTLTAHADAHTKGAYSTLITPTIATYGLWIHATAGATNTAARGGFMDIAWGSSDTIVVPDLDVSAASSFHTGGKGFYIPGLNISANEIIKARFQSSSASSQTMSLAVISEHNLRLGIANSTYTAYGVDLANSRGVTLTTGNGAFGSWVEIDETTADHSVFVFGVDNYDQTALGNNLNYMYEFAVGPDSGTLTTLGYLNTTQVAALEAIRQFGGTVYKSIASGSKIWARAGGGSAIVQGVSFVAL